MFKRRIFAAALALLMCLGMAMTVGAAQNTTYTYTISVDGEWTRTQDAYITGGVCLTDAGLTAPTDLFCYGEYLYVSDSGNARVIRYHLPTGQMDVIGEGILTDPRGLFVDSDGSVYVADAGVPAVFHFALDGTVLLRIDKPDNYLFSQQSVFVPTNVVVTKQNNIFVSGEGAHEGLMQFDKNGEFQGYFAANSRKLTMLERIQELIFTDAQNEQLMSRKARPIQNIDIAPNDLIYSVTQDGGQSFAWSAAEEKTENRVKLHNLAGTNVLAPNKMIDDEWNFVDVAYGMYDCVYTLTYTGIINEYDSTGNLVFSFGGRSVSGNMNGTMTYAAALDVDEQGVVYVLDREQGLVQMFYPNELAAATHQAIYYLDQGNYEESEELWLYLLKLNGMSRLAHLGYGKTLFYQQRYQEALTHFKIANEKELYSECFWELRDTFINRTFIYFVAAAVVLYILWKLIDWLRDKYNLYRKPTALKKHCSFAWSMLRHPIDGFYYAKTEQKANVLSATVLYGVLIVVFVADQLFRGFIFNSSTNDTSVLMTVAVIAVPTALWIVGNHMVSSISDGEGTFRQVYICTAYAATPYIFLTPGIIALSYVLTQNEAFVITLGSAVIVAWTVILLVISVVEVHSYTGKETVKTILLILFFILIAIVVFAIVYLVWMQVYEFIDAVKEELIYRVQK